MEYNLKRVILVNIKEVWGQKNSKYTFTIFYTIIASCVQFLVEGDLKIWRHFKRSWSWIVFNDTKSKPDMKKLNPQELSTNLLFKKKTWFFKVCQFTISYFCVLCEIVGKQWETLNAKENSINKIYFKEVKGHLYQILVLMKIKLINNVS